MKIIFNPPKDEVGLGLSAMVLYRSPAFIKAISKAVDLAEIEEITAIEIHEYGIVVRIGRK